MQQITPIFKYIHIYTDLHKYMVYTVCNYRVLRKCIFRIICMYFCSLVNKKKMFWLYFCGIFRRTDFLIYQYQSKCLIKSSKQITNQNWVLRLNKICQCTMILSVSSWCVHVCALLDRYTRITKHFNRITHTKTYANIEIKYDITVFSCKARKLSYRILEWNAIIF